MKITSAIIKSLSLFIIFFISNTVVAQYRTSVILTDLSVDVIGDSISSNLSRLCSAFNDAQYKNCPLNLANIKITDAAREDLTALWENCHFRCDETEIIQPLLRSSSCWQVRNIPIVMVPDAEAKYDDDLYQELVVNILPNGFISDIYFAVSSHLYSNVIKSNLVESDLNRRLMIMDFVERFRTAYNRKDITFINDVFSDDALIIVGREIKRVPTDNRTLSLNTPRFEQIIKTKTEYIKSLRRVFEANRTVKVDFSEIKVVKHPVKSNYYGVTLKQGWSSDRYGDMGYVFLLVDFRVSDKPVIHVRTWQPERYRSGEVLQEVDIFSISDFECE